MNDVVRRLMQVWAGLGRGPQLLVAGVAILVPVLFFVGSQWMTDTSYVPLFASLTTEDAGAIVTQLKAAKTPYRIGGAGEQILVPADKVNETRLRMAMQGLPLGGGVGFEVFDKSSFGLSDFNQRVNLQRALQGELARTIGQLRGVTRARVHLVMPQPSLFTDRERQPSASVFLKLAPGARLTGEEVRGIVHLVSSSVEGLTPGRVTMVDTAGRVLATGGESGPGDLSPRRLEAKAAVEERIEHHVQSLLDSALGPGQAVTRASAQLTADQVDRTDERFDPTPVTRQETRTIETSKAVSSAPIVAATVPTPTPGPPPGAPGAPLDNRTSNEGSREAATVTYEHSRTVARTLTSPGEIQRLSVAVLLNTATKVTQGPDKKEVREPVVRTPEEIEKIRRIVMGAAGYSQARGDEVTVVEMPFDTSLRDREQALLEQDAGARPATSLTGRPMVVWGAAGGGAVLLVLAGWFLRRRARQRALVEVARTLQMQEGRPAGRQEQLQTLAEQVGGADVAGIPGVPEEFVRLGREREGLRQKAVGLASAEPEVAAQLIRAWMVRKRNLQSVGAGHDG
jgi:flagellar M-ring protein FliF